MATQGITLGEWLPDQAGITGALTEAKNVSPLAVGYGSMSGVANYSDAAAENISTVFAGKFAGQTTLFASGTTKIFKFFALLILSGGFVGALTGAYFIAVELIPYVLKCLD